MNKIELIDFTDFLIETAEKEIQVDWIKRNLIKFRKSIQLINTYVTGISASNAFIDFIKKYYEAFDLKSIPESNNIQLSCFLSNDSLNVCLDTSLLGALMKCELENGETVLLVANGYE